MLQHVGQEPRAKGQDHDRHRIVRRSAAKLFVAVKNRRARKSKAIQTDGQGEGARAGEVRCNEVDLVIDPDLVFPPEHLSYRHSLRRTLLIPVICQDFLYVGAVQIPTGFHALELDASNWRHLCAKNA